MMPRGENDLRAQDSFGALLLGVISILGRVDEFLSAVGDASATSPTLDERDRLVLDALLGVVSLRDTLGNHLHDVPLPPLSPDAEIWRTLASLKR